MDETGARGWVPIRWLIVVAVLLLSARIALAGEALSPFPVAVRAAVLMDAQSGELLYAQDANEHIPPASLTKVLTLFLTFDAIQHGRADLDDIVPVSKKACRTRGSKMFLKAGDLVPLEDLIKGIAVDSGNDASVAVAEYLEGSERRFVAKMNEKLRALGIQHTRIETVHGLPARNQYTTAADMALLARAYIQAHPEALRYHQLTSYTYRNVSQENHNKLLFQDPSVDGLKTGYTRKSGYNLLATAKRGNQRLIAVVLKAKSRTIREEEALRLLNFGFEQTGLAPGTRQLDVPLNPEGGVLPPGESAEEVRPEGV
ncbi:MAG TPA: D-alanyl-D-alanine carboxypeptidase family protein [Desulfatiglandales bacterium]|nr:D-alanyl-D-alanine carboxypeptidase family protein [Desulfatiglandales bacterium]